MCALDMLKNIDKNKRYKYVKEMQISFEENRNLLKSKEIK